MGFYNIFTKKNKLNETKEEKVIDINSEMRASIMGFIVGDALGVPVEFQNRATLKRSKVTGMEEYGTHSQPKGTWSDDSSMMLASMNAIIETDTTDMKKIAEKMSYEFIKWYEKGKYTPFGRVFDIGGTTASAIRNFRARKDIYSCGINLEKANGNGALMRIIPAAFYGLFQYREEERFSEFIFLISGLTHSHAQSKIACLIYSKYLEYLLNGIDKNEAYLKIKDYFKENELLEEKYSKEDINVFNRILTKDIIEFSEDEIKSSGYVVDTLEAVIWTILTTKNYKEAVLTAVNLGDDTDTIAALVGGLAGVIYGYDTIPTEWITCIQKKEEILELIDKFIEKVIPTEEETNTLKEDNIENTLPDNNMLEEITEILKEVKEQDIRENKEIETTTQEILNIESKIEENPSNEIINTKNDSTPKEDSIIFKITNAANSYSLIFTLKKRETLLEFSSLEEPNKTWQCSFSTGLFHEFKEDIDKLTRNWQKEYEGNCPFFSNWSLIQIEKNKVVKHFVGENAYPENWNEFLDYIILFEKICKQKANKTLNK